LQTDLSLGFGSFLACAVLYFLVLVIHLLSRSKRRGRAFLLLVTASLIWSGLLTLSQVGPSLPFEMIMTAELLRLFTWIYVLQMAEGKYNGKWYKLSLSNPLGPSFISILFAVALVSVLFIDHIAPWDSGDILLLEFSWLLWFSVIGLIAVEQLYRNTPKSEQWNVNFICLSAGTVLIYDFFVFSNAVLTSTIDYEFWSARGIVNSLIIPIVVLAGVRNPNLAPDIHISRTFVFHSTTLLGAGVYLILMATAGFYIKESSGDWGKALQAAFLVAALLLLSVVFFSTSIKTRLKRYLTYSFRNKFDYREEWNRFSKTLLSHDSELSLYARALKAIAQIIDCYGASLWLAENGRFSYKARWRKGLRNSQIETEKSPLVAFIQEKKSLFTQDEFVDFCNHSGVTEHWFMQSEDCWLIVPLWLNDDLFGFVVLRKPIIDTQLDIEDIDLLTTVAHHVSVSLFLQKTDTELQNAQRFKDLNQMTAFLVHDLKTVLSQLSLLVANARQHKENPMFVDDMINTVEHATKKMQRLMQQLQKPVGKTPLVPVDVVLLLESIIESYRHAKVKPSLAVTEGFRPRVLANSEELSSAIRHIVQNAVESVSHDGWVEVKVTKSENGNFSIDISDNGVGMTQEFISDRLFRPFDSTKGVSGMGVGVYQARDYVRTLSGDMKVSSELGRGTTFSITLAMES
jgi:putative PEP-CTERM system histidine kinase